jgi:hypothetical protein
MQWLYSFESGYMGRLFWNEKLSINSGGSHASSSYYHNIRQTEENRENEAIMVGISYEIRNFRKRVTTVLSYSEAGEVKKKYINILHRYYICIV